MVEGQLRDSTRSIPTFFTQREPEYDQDTYRHQRESTQVRWGGRDGTREPDSGLGYTQDYRSRGHTRIASIRTQSVSGQNSRRAEIVEWEAGQPVVGYLK